MRLGRKKRPFLGPRGPLLGRLAALLERGVPLPLAMAALEDEPGRSTRARARASLARARAAAEEGRPLADVLSEAGWIDTFDRPLVEAGARHPGRTLRALADAAEAQDAIERALSRALGGLPWKGAAGVLLVAALIAPAFPHLGIWRDQGEPHLVVLALLGALVAVVLALVLSSRVARLFERLADRLPVLHGLQRRARAALFLRTVGAALASGQPLPKALDYAGAALAGGVAAVEVRRLAERAREGAPGPICLSASFLGESDDLFLGMAAERADVADELLALSAHHQRDLVTRAEAFAPLAGALGDLAVILPVVTVLLLNLVGLKEILEWF